MREQPETRYAHSGNVSIAYQVVGNGRVDLVFVPGWVSHIEYAWEEPSLAPFLERLASFSRLIFMDRRGTGLSDPVERLPTLEERMDDLRAVMDAAGSERAFLFGISESGPMCSLFAATWPERTAGLVLCNTTARFMVAPDYSAGATQQQLERFLARCQAEWGTGVIGATIFAPSRAGDEEFRKSWGRFERRSVSPSGISKIVAMGADTDVRHVLPSIRVPTLVIHRREDHVTPVEFGRYLADHIPGAKLTELAGEDHFPWIGDTDSILDVVQQFVTGTRPAPRIDRILATVLFVDIVDSTRHLSERGDSAWKTLLQSFYKVLRQELELFKGREINTTGDGLVATFDGPARGIRCAHAMSVAVRRLGVEIRAGLHSGECELVGDSVAGIAVHIGARVVSKAAPGEILVSSTVKDLVAGSGIQFRDRGTHALHGVPGEWRLYAADASD
jgi:pimeloyl-ACP methyl ester carboxylesterase/class 3 adenylate cyclase